MRLRIVHCATTHRADDPRVFWKECRTLADAGHEVVYVVPHPHDEVVEGVQIRAVPIPRDGKERLLQTTRHVYRQALDEGRNAIIHLHDSDLLLVGLALKAQGRRVVYDAHEDTPKQMRYQHWIPGPLRPIAAGFAGAAEQVCARVFDGLVAAEPENAARFPSARTVLVRNFPEPDELIAQDATPYRERAPVVLYLGSITEVRGLWTMISATRTLRQSGELELVLAGPFYPAKLRARVEGIPGVRLPGYVTRRDVPALMAEARAGLVVLHPEKKYVEAYPTKLFEYMAAGLPVVASWFPVWREIVEEAGAGFAVDPEDPSAVAEALHWLLDHPAEAQAMGSRGRQAVIERFDWKGEGERLVRFYEGLGTASRSRSS